jgi:SAM-dependent methyltransferase
VDLSINDYYGPTDAAIYDDFYTSGVDGDVEFYVDKSKAARGEVLEVGCGTGRIFFPIADAGVYITGMDNAPAMLEIASAKLSAASDKVRANARLIAGDMRSFQLKQQFELILMPFRVFMHMLTVDDQRQALQNLHRHLTPGGRLILNIFDPLYGSVAAHLRPLGWALKQDSRFVRSTNGNTVVAWESQQYSPESQLLEVTYVYDELDSFNRVVNRYYSGLKMRWTHRYEMQNLIEFCGYEIETLNGDFAGGPFRYGREQVWTLRKPET